MRREFGLRGLRFAPDPADDNVFRIEVRQCVRYNSCMLTFYDWTRYRRLYRSVIAACVLVTATPSAGNDRVDLESFFDAHCYGCHSSGEDSEAGVDLTVVSSPVTLAAKPDFLKTLINVIDLGEMPPSGETPLDQITRHSVVETLRNTLSQSIASGQVSKPRTPIRRMNRFQYNNAVQDLFRLKPNVFTLPERMMRDHSKYFDPVSGKVPATVKVGSRPLGKSQMIEPRLAGVGAFPQDLRAENGFDNRGDHLSMSPLLMESFLSLARSIVDSPDFTPRNVGIWSEFFATPNDNVPVETTIRRRLQVFLTRAFRRPVDTEGLDRYAFAAIELVNSGAAFSEAMKQVAAAALASPRFLYLYDSNDEPSQQFDLATRLSFFLAGSIPDDELRQIAAAGSLRDADVLALQVDRLLNDRRLKRFCDSFPAQWLQLDRIVSAVPDRGEFPDFYFAKYRSSMHMMLEPLLVFETVLIEDRPITDLIDSDFSYRSSHLSKLYYDDPREKLRTGQVGTIPFERVSISDRRYGGCITTAAVMAMTSGTHETKPITRGAWLTTVIFNNPPEPPPADVPPLPEKPKAEEANFTLRERLDAHRERADCAGCHQRIDPLGFALENFGPTGKWREGYANGREIDMAGMLFRRYPFDDVVSFKDAILAEKTRFTRAFAAHVLSFALARELVVADEPSLDQIVKNTAQNDYRIRMLLREVVLCDAFRGTDTENR